MRLSYKLKDGSHIKIFNYDILESQAENHDSYWRKNVSGYLTDCNDEDTEMDLSLPVLKEDDRFYFMAFGQKIYFDDYEYLPLEELMQRLEDEEYLSSDMILASLIKNADKVAFIEPRMVPDTAYGDIGVRSYSGKIQHMGVVCLPIERLYPRYNWAYKIETLPIAEDDVLIFGAETHYAIDYCGWINSGYVKILPKDNIKDYHIQDEKSYVRKRVKED